MPSLHAELTQSITPAVETSEAPFSPDQASVIDPEIATALVSEFRRDTIILAALNGYLESASHTHGPTAATAQHAASIAMQRIEMQTTYSMKESLSREVPPDITEFPPDILTTYAFDKKASIRVSNQASGTTECATGAFEVPVDPKTDVISRKALYDQLSANPSPFWQFATKTLRRLGVIEPYAPSDYYSQAIKMHNDHIAVIRHVETHGLPGYTRDELTVIQGALTALLNTAPSERFELLASEEPVVMDAAERTEIVAVATLIKDHAVEEVESFHDLVHERGRVEAVKAVASGKMVLLVTAAGEIVTLPHVESAELNRYF